jgi:hypothetical protein
MRLLSALLVAFAAPIIVRPPAPPQCAASSVDKSEWRAHRSAAFGIQFFAPLRYDRKYWESSGSNFPRKDTTDVEAYWPNNSVRWIFDFSTVRGEGRAIPDSGTNYRICTEPWSGRNGTIAIFVAGQVSTGPSTFAPSHHVRASWPLGAGRTLTFHAADADSTKVAEMYGIASTVRFNR